MSVAFGLDLKQPAKGYRYSIDAFLLAFFSSRFQAASVVDAGCGCGVISLLMAKQGAPVGMFELFEIQPELCQYAKRNVLANPVPGYEFSVRCEDIRFAIPSRKPELMVCNPPFRSPKTGRISANSQRAIARNWFFLHPKELFAAFLQMRANRQAGICLILPVELLSAWKRFAEDAGLFVNDLLYIHPFADRAAALVSIRFSAAKGTISEERIVLYEKGGVYTGIGQEILGKIC